MHQQKSKVQEMTHRQLQINGLVWMEPSHGFSFSQTTRDGAIGFDECLGVLKPSDNEEAKKPKTLSLLTSSMKMYRIKVSRIKWMCG